MRKKKRCNVCGTQLDMWDRANGVTVEEILGYGSRYDLHRVKVRFCHSCFDALLDSCKVSPFVANAEPYWCKGVSK